MRNALPYERVQEIAVRFGIRMAKGQYVDLAEEAVDVSRNGGFPICLRLVLPPGRGGELVEHRLREPEEIRQAYERLANLIPSNPGARVLALREGHMGHELALYGRIDEAGRKLIELSVPARVGNRREVVAEVLPVDGAEARRLVGALRETHVLPAVGHIVRTLADLIMRASEMFEGTPIKSFVFDPLRVNATGYEVLLATMTSAGRLGRQPRKAAPRERDRKGYYTPSGRQ